MYSGNAPRASLLQPLCTTAAGALQPLSHRRLDLAPPARRSTVLRLTTRPFNTEANTIVIARLKQFTGLLYTLWRSQ